MRSGCLFIFVADFVTDVVFFLLPDDALFGFDVEIIDAPVIASFAMICRVSMKCFGFSRLCER